MNGSGRAARTALSLLAAFSLVVQPAMAIDPAIKVTVVAQETALIPTLGNITTIDNVDVNESGITIVEVDTNNANTDIDGAVLLNGALAYQEGQALAAPAGASLDTFDAININDSNNSGWNFFLDGTTGTNDDSGLYFNSTLLIQEGDFVTAPGVGPNSPFRGFFDVHINDNDELLIRASIDDTAVGTTIEQALIVRDAAGNQTLIAADDHAPPGFPALLITDIESNPNEFWFNNAGDVMWNCDTDAATGADGMIFINQTLIAREGDPSPLTGRNYLSLSGAQLSLNEQGDYVHSASLDGASTDNAVLIKNGAKFRQEGDSLPAIGGVFKFTSFGTGELIVTDRGAPDEDPDVLWYGDWDDPNADVDTGLFLDGQMLLQEGVDVISGLVVDSISSIADAREMSDDGRYIITEVQLVGGIDTAVLLDLGPWDNLGKSKMVTTRPKLRGFGQLTPGSTVTVRLTNGLPNGTTNLIIGTSRVDVPVFGGTLVPSPDIVVFNVPLDANGELTIQGTLDPSTPPGSTFYIQFWNQDGFNVSASNAVGGVTQ